MDFKNIIEIIDSNSFMITVKCKKCDFKLEIVHPKHPFSRWRTILEEHTTETSHNDYDINIGLIPLKKNTQDE
jgi:hypothetical protein